MKGSVRRLCCRRERRISKIYDAEVELAMIVFNTLYGFTR